MSGVRLRPREALNSVTASQGTIGRKTSDEYRLLALAPGRTSCATRQPNVADTRSPNMTDVGKWVIHGSRHCRNWKSSTSVLMIPSAIFLVSSCKTEACSDGLAESPASSTINSGIVALSGSDGCTVISNVSISIRSVSTRTSR